MTGRAVTVKEAGLLASSVRELVKRPHWRAAPVMGEGEPTSWQELPLTTGLRTASVRLLELLLRMAGEDQVAEVSTSYASRVLHLSVRAVERARMELRLAQLVEIERVGRPAPGVRGGGIYTRYRVLLDRIRQLVRDARDAARSLSTSRPGVGTSPDPGSVPEPSPGRYPSRPGVGTPTRTHARSQGPEVPEPPFPPKSTDAPEPVDAGGSPPAPPRSCDSCKGRRPCRKCHTTPRELAAVERERKKRQEAEQARVRAEERTREDAARDSKKASEYLALSRAVKRGEIRPEDVPEPVNGAVLT